MSNPRKKIDKYIVHLDKKLGVGSFGTVYIGFHIDTKDKVAIKMLDKKTIQKDQYIKQALFAEIDILKALKSPNIVGFLDVMESSNFYYIVQEFCDGGDLRSLLIKRGSLKEQEAIAIVAQVCNGFVELLKEGIIHRDLKPENILINNGVVKICDFGFSKKTNSKRLKNSTIVGTPLYMSIEILKGEQYTSKCDIWALGFIFYELLHGTPPWNGASEYQLITHLEGCPLKFYKPLSAITKSFLSRCLAVQEAQRMNWDQLLRHEMFNGMFAHYVAKEHQFENKFKTIMAQLRYEINSNNIDLDRLIEMYGFGRLRDLDFKAFDRLMRAIDPDLTIEEVRFIFEKLDQDDSNTVSLVEFQAALVQNNIPLKSHYGMPPKKESSKEKDPDDQRDQTSRRFAAALLKMEQKLRSCKLSLREVLVAYGINKEGLITVDLLAAVLARLDAGLGPEDLRMVLELIAGQPATTVSLQQFEHYYQSCLAGRAAELAQRRANSS